MRDAFAKEITALAGEDERIVLLSGDIGNRMFDDFKKRYPDRFYNCGVAEANMTSVGAGLALNGLRPFTYTIASFGTIRCLEQIRVDVCYHRTRVVIVGVGAGLSYAENGATHLACEDIAILRSLPNLAVVCPGDAHEVRSVLRALANYDGPAYVRLGKKGEPLVHEAPPAITIGKALVVRPGQQVALLSTGNLLPLAMETGKALQDAGIGAEVVSFHTVKPLDTEYLTQAFGRFKLVATLEEHSRLGGFGGAVAEWLVDQGNLGAQARLLRFGTRDSFPHLAGAQEYARECHGLTASALSTQILNTLKG